MLASCIYARLIAKKYDDKHYVLVSRLATAGVLGIGFAYIPFISSKATMLDAFLTLIPVFVTPLFTIYLIGILTRAPASAGIAGILTGGLYGVIALTDREIWNIPGLASWFTSKWPAYSWAMLFTALGSGIASLFCRNSPEMTEKDAGWLDSSSQSLEAIPEHPFQNALPKWLQPEWLAGGLILATAAVLFGFFW